MAATKIEQEWFTPRQVSQWTGIPELTLRNWRHYRADGPPYTKAGRLVRYRKRDVEKWLESKRVESS